VSVEYSSVLERSDMTDIDRYSKKVKGIIGRYDLKPAPKIIEVDLRGE